MSGDVFVLRDDDELVPMEQTGFKTEAVFQALLSKFPQLLGGRQMGDVPRRWVLVKREWSIRNEEDGAGRW